MAKRKSNMSVFAQMKAGLEDCLAHAKDELTLATVQSPAPPPKADARKIVAIRHKLRMSQSVFAATLNVSMRTVQSWEQGLRTPSDASLRLLQIVGTQPAVVEALFAQNTVSAKPRIKITTKTPSAI